MSSASAGRPTISPTSYPGAAFLAATSLTFLKPRFKRAFRPLAGRLADAGVTANQVTVTSLIGSITVSAILCGYPEYTALFVLLPAWLFIRMGCATVDGTLATEFGQKSRLGGILNEVGDIVSEVAVFLPFAFVPPLSLPPILLLIGLVLLAEIAGILGERCAGGRRLEGPLGKADRTIALAIIAIVIAALGRLPGGLIVVVPVLALGLVLTIWNRARSAIAERHREIAP